MNSENHTDLRELATDLLKISKTLNKSHVAAVTSLAGDGSGRSFYRVRLENAPVSSAVLVLHGKSRIPQFSGSSTLSQEEAFAELSGFFRRHGYAVPEVYSRIRENHTLLVEDVGDLAFFRIIQGERNSEIESILEKIGGDGVFQLLASAIGAIGVIQSIPFDKNCVAFQRYLAFENYRREISEFLDYYLDGKGLKPSAKEVLNKVFDAICEIIASFPRVLSHFDFNAWNLFVGPGGEIRILDYQDACLVTPARDIVSLINDRGMDELLGQSLHRRLLNHYMEVIKPVEDFQHIYNLTLLHWDFRVAGRFVKLCRNANTDRYLQWLPGTVRRLGRTLVRSYKTVHHLDDVMEILMELIPEVHEGVNDPWEFPS